MKPKFFESASEFRTWLSKNHATSEELLLGFFKKGSGKGGIAYLQAVEEALCFGWIDGHLKNYDESRYIVRFTPRRPRSIWSAVNIKRVESLLERGLMQPAGLAAYARRSEERSRIYSYEQKEHKFSAAEVRAFKAKKKAWAFFQAQPPSYQRASKRWLTAAKRQETREKRFAELIACSESEKRVPQFTPWVANKPHAK